MRTTAFRSTLAVALAAGVVAAATPARAELAPVQASSPPGVVFEECAGHPISYSVSPPADAWSWSVQFVLQAPDGTSAGSATVTSSEPATGVELVQFCGSSKIPGTYTVTGTYQYFVGMSMTTAEVAPFTFDMRMPLAALDARPSVTKVERGKVVKVKVKATDERPTGAFFGTPDARVVLQRQIGGRWVKVRGAKATTRTNGSAQLRFRNEWKGKSRFRAFANLGYPGKVASPVFTVRTRR